MPCLPPPRLWSWVRPGVGPALGSLRGCPTPPAGGGKSEWGGGIAHDRAEPPIGCMDAYWPHEGSGHMGGIGRMGALGWNPDLFAHWFAPAPARVRTSPSTLCCPFGRPRVAGRPARGIRAIYLFRELKHVMEYETTKPVNQHVWSRYGSRGRPNGRAIVPPSPPPLPQPL